MIATQDYGWTQHALRAGFAWPEATDWAMAQAAAAGFTAWEPLLGTPEDASRVGDLGRALGLALRSIFLTGVLHEPALAKQTRARFRTVAAVAAGYGCKQAMVYPSARPGQAAKSDTELVLQAEQLGLLARDLRLLGVQLCYHPEEVEMRLAAREFHHMLLATNPTEVALCLDPDAIWRGAGQSHLALMDTLTMHGSRTAALHLRQSQGGTWNEVLGPGDLDYPAILATLDELGARPALILELALEKETEVTLDPLAAHAASLSYIRQGLAPLVRAA